MTLSRWLANGWVQPHETTPEEVADLLAVVARDIEDASIDRLSPDWQQGIAYNAALQLAVLALAAEGYRPSRERAHERAIRSLEHTVGVPSGLVITLDAVRRSRNASNYERAGTVSPSEAREVLQLAYELRNMVLEWLAHCHPHLSSRRW